MAPYLVDRSWSPLRISDGNSSMHRKLQLSNNVDECTRWPTRESLSVTQVYGMVALIGFLFCCSLARHFNNEISFLFLMVVVKSEYGVVAFTSLP